MFSLPRDEAMDDGMPVTVVFRRYPIPTHVATAKEARERVYGGEGEIIALFPFIPATITNAGEEPECMCYMHVGQHGAAEYFHVIGETTPVSKEELATGKQVTELIRELNDRGYSLSPMLHEEVCYEAGFKKGQDEARDSRAVIGDCTGCKSTNCMLRDCPSCGESVCDDCIRSGKKQSEELAYCVLCIGKK